MPTSLFLIFNHTFTDTQRKDALNSLGVSQVVDLPDELKKIWSDIPPDLIGIKDYLEPIQIWLKNNAAQGDFVLIQGDFGACCIMVNFSFENGLIPIYSTTERKMQEEILADGHIRLTHQFSHRIFRRYET